MSKFNMIVKHKLVQVIEAEGTAYRVLITMENGVVVEHKPFPYNQAGLVGAMQLATEVMAGKIWLSHVHSAGPGWKAPTAVQLEASQKELISRSE